MGFGIALFGYGFLLLNEVGGALFGVVLLAYGFFLASRLEAGFMRASVSSLFMLPRGILLFFDILGIVDIDTIPTVNVITFILYLTAWALMSYFWLGSVVKIAKDCKAERLEIQARKRLVFTVFAISLALFAGVANLLGVLGELAFMVSMAQYILQYAVIFVNIMFLHTCFVLITSEAQYQQDKQQLAAERAKAIEKRYNEKQEVERKIEKRKKK